LIGCVLSSVEQVRDLIPKKTYERLKPDIGIGNKENVFLNADNKGKGNGDNKRTKRIERNAGQ
jgi:hypothetical protein